jgi:organic radical activating enzyme
MELNNLIIEVTRKCNMSCDHCLRGDQQNIDIDLSYIEDLLKQVTHISSITFTGGEPSLNVPAINFTLSKAKEFGISIGFFYIATNAKKVTEDFIMSCLKLYAYCDEKDCCRVDISNDYYHLLEGSYDSEILDCLSFVGRKYRDEGETFDKNVLLLDEGNAKINNIGHRVIEKNEIISEKDFNDAELYLNCFGNIIIGCNWSYINQDYNIFCDVKDLKKKYMLLVLENVMVE